MVEASLPSVNSLRIPAELPSMELSTGREHRPPQQNTRWRWSSSVEPNSSDSKEGRHHQPEEDKPRNFTCQQSSLWHQRDRTGTFDRLHSTGMASWACLSQHHNSLEISSQLQ
ncbi:hypothetical protein MUG91_G22n35 [Manis pentadactyla]|nr:hypothetical protein MUG91_G22n35 [Manis pentadactyla]